MSSGVVSVAPDVATLLGPAATARVLQQRTDMICCSCRTEVDLDAGDDASAVVEQSDQTLRIVFAHSTCMASQVIGDAPPSGLPAAGEQTDVVATAAILPTVDGPRPWLFIQQSDAPRLLTPAGDEIHPYLSEFLSRGWTVLGALGRPAPRVSTAELLLDATGRGILTAHDGETLLDPLPALPEAWPDLVSSYGWVDVGVGDFGLVRGRQDSVQLKAFTQAAKRGGLVAGRVPVRVSSTPLPATGDPVAARLAADLQDVVATRARPGGTDRFSSAPDVVRWPRPPRLYQVQITDRFAGLWIDLHDPDRSRAAATIAALESEGLPRRRSMFDDGHFAVGPSGWGALVWRSQILIMGGKTPAGDQRKLLFQQLPTAPDWYSAVQQASSVGILVGNLRCQPDERVIERAMAGGEVLACVVTAMMA